MHLEHLSSRVNKSWKNLWLIFEILCNLIICLTNMIQMCDFEPVFLKYKFQHYICLEILLRNVVVCIVKNGSELKFKNIVSYRQSVKLNCYWACRHIGGVEIELHLFLNLIIHTGEWSVPVE